MNKLLLAFSIGATFSVGTQIYISKGFHNFKHKLPSSSGHVEFLFPFSLLMMGLMNVLNVYTNDQYTLIIGFFVGFLFSSVGISMGLNKYWKINETQARIFAFIYYPLLFVLISRFNKLIN